MNARLGSRWGWRREWVGAGVLLLLCALIAGCTGVPRDGAVSTIAPSPSPSGVSDSDLEARPPQPNATPIELVEGFLDSLVTNPAQTRTAHEFLTPAAQETWNPQAATVVHAGTADLSLVPGDLESIRPGSAAPTVVELELDRAWRLDSGGTWLGEISGNDLSLSFELELIDGQWRIAALPDALVVPLWWFKDRFRATDLYYLNNDESALVPDPVFLPLGPDLATEMVRGLLERPSAADVTRTAIPARLKVGLSVPVTKEGVAEVSLVTRGDPPKLDPQRQELIAAQIGRTLRQHPDVVRVRLTISGREIDPDGGRPGFSTSAVPIHLDRLAYGAEPPMVGLSSEGILAGSLPAMKPLQTALPPGTQWQAVARSLDGRRIAALGMNRRELKVAAVGPGTWRAPLEGRSVQRLEKPLWDAAGRLWVLDRRDDGEVVWVIDDNSARPLKLPVSLGASITRIVVSPDATRLILWLQSGAEVAGRSEDNVVSVRIAERDRGSGLSRRWEAVGTPLTLAAPEGNMMDIAWHDPATVTLLYRTAGRIVAANARVDGSSQAWGGEPVAVPQDVVSLMGSPTTALLTFGLASDVARSLDAVGRNEVIAPGLRALTYVG